MSDENRAWLIEDSRYRVERIQYWTGYPDFTREVAWTTNIETALWFVRKQDAEQASLLLLKMFDARVIEHMWVDTEIEQLKKEFKDLLSDLNNDREQVSELFDAVVTQRDNAEMECARLRTLYTELLYAVSRVHPNQNRHQTALRYIQRAERQSNESGKASGGQQ